MYDNKLRFIKAKNLKNFDYIHINESKNSELIDIGFRGENFYLIDKNLQTKILNFKIKNIDLKNLCLLLSLDPKNLQVRYDDDKVYRAWAFDGFSFEKLGEFEI